MKNVVLIGDSIRMGYQDTVRQELGDAARVWTPSENGGTSANVLEHLEEWALSRDPDVVHVNCGLHDLAKEFDSETNRVPRDAYENNVRSILQQLKDKTNARVIWASTTAVNQERHHKNKPFDRFEADVEAYNAVAADVCAGFGVEVNDLYKAVVDAGRDELLLDDGVHFKPEGYALLGKSVAECLRGVI